MATEKIKLDVDWDSLFPGTTVTIGKQVVLIKPLTWEEISNLVTIIRPVINQLVDAGVTLDNVSDKAHVITVAEVLVVQFTDILSDVTKIEVADLKRLPIDIIVELVAAVVEVNVQSKESLEKNLHGLIEKLQDLGVTQKTPVSETSSKS